MPDLTGKEMCLSNLHREGNFLTSALHSKRQLASFLRSTRNRSSFVSYQFIGYSANSEISNVFIIFIVVVHQNRRESKYKSARKYSAYDESHYNCQSIDRRS